MADTSDSNPEPPAWIVESSTHVFRDRWISVRADSCRTPEGAKIAPFYVLEYADWVQVVALDDQEHVILVEQYRHGLGITSLELPTGGMELTDTTPVEAAQRELAEETGFTADSWQHIATLAPNPANQNNRCHAVLALGARLSGIPNDDPTERVRVLRVPVAEAVRLARSGAIVQALHVAALALALTAIGRW
jgi:8-oxo-dGTP pyrophosphatase MutT (NUDIX family)